MTVVLLIEDSLGDARLFAEKLMESGVEQPVNQFTLSVSNRLSQGLAYLDQDAVDIVVLDLQLPDTTGLDTLIQFRQRHPELPVVVLTGRNDGELAIQAMQAGAQDYLLKGEVSADLLQRSLRYALQRNQLLLELERSYLREQQEREFRSLERFSINRVTAVTAQLYGLKSLRTGLPDIFNDLVDQYQQVLEWALERQMFKVEHPISETLYTLAERLGVLRASPRDAVELHTAALKQKREEGNRAKSQAYAEEGRYLLLELMGNLASYYRNYALGRMGNLASRE